MEVLEVRAAVMVEPILKKMHLPLPKKMAGTFVPQVWLHFPL
jgi:hypothetical protein